MLAGEDARQMSLTPVGRGGTGVHLEVDAAATAEDVRARNDGTPAAHVRRLHGVSVESSFVVAAHPVVRHW